ncbi:MAG TPA: NAD(P)H-binding protein, partial [Chitinophagaceae bacterium]|nr:NAD(P)H-binding protein [Chitinophagaceae bacterium]
MATLKLLMNEMDSNDLRPNRLDMGTDNSIDRNKQKKIRILVSGASGFIGRRLVRRLLVSPSTTNWSIRCMTRKAQSLSSYFQNDRDNLEFVQADVQNYAELVKALIGVDVAFYLIHSMEGSSKEWKKFAERDRVAAENFAQAVNEAGVSRVIYLGGLTYAPEQELSKHMQSRKQV